MKLNSPDWGDNSFSIALEGQLQREGLQFLLILNAYWEPLEFELPSLPAGKWSRWVDTSLDSPNDITPWNHAVPYPMVVSMHLPSTTAEAEHPCPR